MLPTRKSSNLFRERKVPNRQQFYNATQKNSVKQLQLNGTQVLKLTKVDSKRQIYGNMGSLEPKITQIPKTKFEQPSYEQFLQSIRNKINLLQKQNCTRHKQTQAKETSPKPSINQKTKQSQNGSLQKSIMEQSPMKQSKIQKTDFGEKILKQIQQSMNRTQRSGSMLSKGQKKKKRMIQQCKVVKIPWKSSKGKAKTQFNPEVSMIEKNPSCLPTQSLREICENLN